MRGRTPPVGVGGGFLKNPLVMASIYHSMEEARGVETWQRSPLPRTQGKGELMGVGTKAGSCQCTTVTSTPPIHLNTVHTSNMLVLDVIFRPSFLPSPPSNTGGCSRCSKTCTAVTAWEALMRTIRSDVLSPSQAYLGCSALRVRVLLTLLCHLRPATHATLV